MFSNALVIDTLRGLITIGQPQRAYLNCLVLQVFTVVAWWPGGEKLTSGGAPVTLFATLIALGATLAYHSARLGAEEIRYRNQQSVRDWLHSAGLPLSRLFTGYFIAHVIQTLHWILWSGPIVLIAWSVDSRDWRSLTLSLGVIVLLATVFRYAGILVNLVLGRHQQFTWYGVRMALVALLVIPAVIFPATNYWLLTAELLGMSYTGESPDSLLTFALFYLLCLAVLGLVTSYLAHRFRSTR